MKKQFITLVFFCATFLSFAQQDNEATSMLKANHEISTNLFDLVVAGSLNVNYERFFKNNQSLLIGATFFDTYGYYDVGYIENTNAFSLKAAYLIYFSQKKDHAGFYFYPQLKFRTGTVKADSYSYYDSNNMLIQVNDEYKVDGFSAGFGIGHKWLFKNKFSLAVFAEVSRDFGNIDLSYLTKVEPRFGVQLGYRF